MRRQKDSKFCEGSAILTKDSKFAHKIENYSQPGSYLFATLELRIRKDLR